MAYGEIIENLLREKNMTVTELAKQSNIKATTLYTIISENREDIKINQLKSIAEALGVEIWDLIGVDRETARQNKNSLEEFDIFYTDDEKYREHKFQKRVYEQEEKDMVDYYYSSIVPVLKNLGYKSHYFVYNSEHSIILEKGGKEWEMAYKDAKEAVSDSLYLADYLLNKHFGKVRKITKERMDALHNSPTKEVSTYNGPSEAHIEQQKLKILNILKIHYFI